MNNKSNENVREYEMMYVLRLEYVEEGEEEKLDRLTTILESEGGKVQEIDKWGKKKLAYPIEDCTEGYYVLFHFSGPENSTGEISERSNVEEGVLRYEMVQKDKVGHGSES